MAVNWIGDTANTPLKAKYDLAVSKTDELKNVLISKNINTSRVDNLYTSLDTLTMNSLDIVSTSVDKILAVTNCLASVDPDTKNDLLNTMKNTVNKVLNGDVLDSYIENVQNIIDNIDNIINEAGDDAEVAVNAALDQTQNNTNTVINAINNAVAANSELDEATQKFAQNLGKAAAVINCLDDAIVGDAQLGDNIEKVNPSLKGVVSAIREAKNEGKDKTTILNEANAKISSNLNLSDKYVDTKNKMSSFI